MDYATPPTDVSAFCRATLSRLIPNEMWGIGDVGQENRNVIVCHVDRFVKARRFESLSLHVLSEGLKVCVEQRCPNMILLTKHRLLVCRGLLHRMRSLLSRYRSLIFASAKKCFSSSSTMFSTRCLYHSSDPISTSQSPTSTATVSFSSATTYGDLSRNQPCPSSSLPCSKKSGQTRRGGCSMHVLWDSVKFAFCPSRQDSDRS